MLHGPVRGPGRRRAAREGRLSRRAAAPTSGTRTVPGIGYGACSYYGAASLQDLPRAASRCSTSSATRATASRGAWIVWERHCEGQMGSFFGEVRVGLPDAPGPRTVPSHVRFPEAEPGGHSITVPVEVRGDAPITDARIVGDDFELVSHTCTGASTCEVKLRAVPGAAGARTAKLRVTDARARAPTSRSRCSRAAGRRATRWSRTPASGSARAGRGPTGRTPSSTSAARASDWTADSTAPNGEWLGLRVRAARTETSSRPARPTAPPRTATGPGRTSASGATAATCGAWRGTFTVHELALARERPRPRADHLRGRLRPGPGRVPARDLHLARRRRRRRPRAG